MDLLVCSNTFAHLKIGWIKRKGALTWVGNLDVIIWYCHLDEILNLAHPLIWNSMSSIYSKSSDWSCCCNTFKGDGIYIPVFVCSESCIMGYFGWNMIKTKHKLLCFTELGFSRSITHKLHNLTYMFIFFSLQRRVRVKVAFFSGFPRKIGRTVRSHKA